MRFTALARLALLSALVLGAFTHNAQAITGTIVSSFNCPLQFPASKSDGAYPSDRTIIDSTTACIKQHMSVAPGVEIFDQMSTLDSNDCLNANPDAFVRAQGTPSVPQCCLKTFPAGWTLLHCDVLSQ